MKSTVTSDLATTVEVPCWKVSRVDLYEFLRSLTTLTPTDSILCLEGVNAVDIEKYLLKQPSVSANYTNPKMRPKIFYLPVREGIMQELSTLAEGYAEAEVCTHL